MEGLGFSLVESQEEAWVADNTLLLPKLLNMVVQGELALVQEALGLVQGDLFQ